MRLISFQDKRFTFEKVGHNQWALQEDFSVRLSEHCHSIDITIPKGFLTDFRSGPDFINFIVPKFGMWFVIHDYLYQKGLVSRYRSDMEQHYWMKKEKVPFFDRVKITIGVRLFGQKYWDYYRSGGEFPYPADLSIA